MKYKNLFVVVALAIFIVPQVVFAAWWNPLSWSIWSIFRPNHQVQQVQIATTTIPTALATTTAKADTKVIPPKKPVAESTQKTSQSLPPKQITENTPDIVVPPVVVPPTPSCTQDIWSCGDWNTCSASGNQTRNCTKTFDCPSINTQSPILSQSCTPPAPTCQSDTWECGNWDSCSASGNQTRSCSKTFECPSIVTPSPITSRSCTPPTPSCQADTWSCGDWNTCSASGNQTRNCTKTFDCSSANTPSPASSQSCTPPAPIPTPNPVLSYEDQHCPKVIKIEDSLGNSSSNDRYLRATFKKGDAKTITIKITTSDPQNLPLFYQFKDESGLTNLPQSQWFDWSTDNSFTLDLKDDISPGTNKFVWYTIDNRDEFTCYFDADVQGMITYTVLP